jgi:hypothetical protein
MEEHENGVDICETLDSMEQQLKLLEDKVEALQL